MWYPVERLQEAVGRSLDSTEGVTGCEFPFVDKVYGLPLALGVDFLNCLGRRWTVSSIAVQIVNCRDGRKG